MSTSAPDPGGTPLGQRYLLHDVIGRGAMGRVYRATRRDTGEELAAKVLHPELTGDETVVARFVQEGVILTRIRDPHVVKVVELLVDGENLAIVSDLVRGTDLRRYLNANGPLPPARVASVTAQLLRGLAAGHAQGVVHRDVKPENVLVEFPNGEPDGDPVVRVTDFGVARLAATPGLTRMTGLIGTPHYMAPELSVPSPVTDKVDVYGAGILAYELLCGVTPFAEGHPMAVLKAHIERLPGPMPGLPAPLWEVLSRMLAKDPQDRPAALMAAGQLEAMVPGLAGVAPLPALAAPPPSLPVPDARATLFREPRPGLADPDGSLPASGRAAPAEGRRARRPIVLGAAAVLAVLLATATWAVVGRGGTPASVEFPLSVVGGNVAVSRSYSLDGTTLAARIRLTSIAVTPTDVSFPEVIPKSVARTADRLRNLQPAHSQVVQSDPVLLFTFPKVQPGGTVEISYRSTVAADGPAGRRLERLKADQQSAEAAYDRQNAIVVAQLQSISVTPPSAGIALGQSVTLTLTGTLDTGGSAPADALAATWTSSRPDVVAVSGADLRGVRPRTAAVTAAVGRLSAQVTVSVAGPAASPDGAPTTPGRSSRPPTHAASTPPVSTVTPPAPVTVKPVPSPSPTTSLMPSSPAPTAPAPTQPAPPPTATTDRYPCGAQFTETDDSTGHRAQRCPLASGNVPVFDSPDLGNGAHQVGVLQAGGSTNWFVGQSYHSTFVQGTLRNGWWAFTLSDKDASGNSHWGWVPETYFQGGNNDEPDAGLFFCDTHGNSCAP